MKTNTNKTTRTYTVSTKTETASGFGSYKFAKEYAIKRGFAEYTIWAR